MRSLETYQVEDWSAFIAENDIDLSCPTCKGLGENEDTREGCEDCGGSGYIEVMWNTIWNTGFHSAGRSLPWECGSVFAFEHERHVWFGLGACGMDLTPHLAEAWLELFPDCQWLPDQFIVTGTNLRLGYVESCVGKKTARRIYAKIGETIKGTRKQAAYLAEDLKEARKRLAAKK